VMITKSLVATMALVSILSLNISTNYDAVLASKHHDISSHDTSKGTAGNTNIATSTINNHDDKGTNGPTSLSSPTHLLRNSGWLMIFPHSINPCDSRPLPPECHFGLLPRLHPLSPDCTVISCACDNFHCPNPHVPKIIVNNVFRIKIEVVNDIRDSRTTASAATATIN
jgi:hypothetical protein